MKFLAKLLICLAASMANVSTHASTMEGTWEGNLQLAPHQALPLVLRVSQTKNGEWQGKLDSPVQNALGMELSKFELNDQELVFELDAIGVHYSGSYDEASDTITGTFIQGRPMPLTFVREFKREIPTTVEIETLDQLVGEWHGRIQSIKLPFTLKVEKTELGYTALASSPFQGKGSMATSKFELEGGELILEIDELDVRYIAKISEDSTALSGNFDQSSLSSKMVLDKQMTR